MKKLIWPVIIVVFLSVIGAIGHIWIQSDSQPYVVLIYALDPNGVTKWSGSGCFIRSDLILTAGHVVQDTERFEIVLPNGHIRPGYFAYIEDVNLTDVGLVKVRGDYPVTSFGHTPHLGRDVWIAGYAFAERPLTLTKGIISCVDRDSDFFGKINLLQVDSAAWPGHSGSPVLDNHNRIVGILVGGLVESDNWSICVPVKIIRLSLVKYDVTAALEVLCD